MKRILYYDCFAGISGDMNLAAMIDLGVDPEYLRRELSKLDLDDAFSLEITKANRKGIHGTQVQVQALEQSPAHRHFADIEDIITGSTLSPAIQKTALTIFRDIAAAEGKVHNMAPEAVHFHEVGAVDSLIDVVGAAICYHALGADAVWSSPIELGGGFVTCAHGTIPVPAPATTEILKGIPVTLGAVSHEATTPTGAAILAALSESFLLQPAFTIEKTGYGVGHRDVAIPNVLRCFLANAPEER